MPANDRGRATFVVPESYGTVVQVRAFCEPAYYPGDWLGTYSVTLNNQDKSWNVPGNC